MSNSHKVTISDIARRANVSPSTVSRVLRGTTVVSEEKHQAVLDAVERLNYRPNIFAQSLASGRSMVIGVLTQRFGSPFYDGILQGILHGLEQTAYSPLFADGRWNNVVEAQALQTLIDRQVDGLILIGGQLPADRLQKLAAELPLIVVGREIETLLHQCLTVKNREAAYRAVSHLIELGHQHIAHITGPNMDDPTSDITHRYEGYRDALRDAGIEFDPRRVVSGTLQQQSGVIAVEALLTRGRPFSAIFAANDQMAFGARLALYRHGIRVPEDVSMIGFDDEASAGYMIPPLTTLRQPAQELGEAATRAVLALIEGTSEVAHRFEAEFIRRESVTRAS
ncbi:MAG: LacI family DNA-binding transcriptional regulator [Chloroflexota bacterium]